MPEKSLDIIKLIIKEIDPNKILVGIISTLIITIFVFLRRRILPVSHKPFFDLVWPLDRIYKNCFKEICDLCIERGCISI